MRESTALLNDPRRCVPIGDGKSDTYPQAEGVSRPCPDRDPPVGERPPGAAGELTEGRTQICQCNPVSPFHPFSE